jgi:DNA-binding transcriptional LysR family regulator
MQEVNFHQLQLFYRVIESGSFSRAAEEMFISQPAVSAQVKELEISLGLKLVERGGKTVQLTQAGKMIYRYAAQIFALAEEMNRTVLDYKGLAAGQLTIASSTTVGECILPQALGQFKSSYPGIKLILQIANSSQVVEKVLARQYDLGFVGEEISHPELEVEPFYQDEIVFFVGANHPLAQRTEIDLEEFRTLELAFVMREEGSATRHCVESKLAELELKIQPVMELGSNEAVKRAVVAGLGMGMLSSCTLLPEHYAKMIKIIPVKGLHCRRYFSYIHRRNRELLNLEKRFLETAFSALSQLETLV